MFMGRALIVAGVPGVMVVVVAMIPANPHGFPVGARPAALVNRRRRTNTNHYLRN
jgi:hypothetical protein